MPMLALAVGHLRDSISSLVDGREEVSLSPIGIIAGLFRLTGSMRCVDRSGYAVFAPPHMSLSPMRQRTYKLDYGLFKLHGELIYR